MKRHHLAVSLALIAVTLGVAAYRGATRVPVARQDAVVASFLPAPAGADSAVAADGAGTRAE
ncbi:hypothetical protein [Longimicrobium sp.]|uniref:hypothetical protein n=1 Tax=Longimicrobium sp. TaxID=2029185 RepID=UPI002E2FB28B|nr:hypothetical protein [Longimicrobium sp.]HEX6039092.1 hypothetical protein [Longimicrobium sp.]